MASSQFSVRIPPELDEKVKEYAVVNHTTKSRVMIDALTYYLGNIDDIPLSQKVMKLEKRITSIEAKVGN
jgi:predicted DNA-binding protein